MVARVFSHLVVSELENLGIPELEAWNVKGALVPTFWKLESNSQAETHAEWSVSLHLAIISLISTGVWSVCLCQGSELTSSNENKQRKCPDLIPIVGNGGSHPLRGIQDKRDSTNQIWAMPRKPCSPSWAAVSRRFKTGSYPSKCKDILLGSWSWSWRID